MELLEAKDGRFAYDPERDPRMRKHVERYGGHSLNDKEILKQFLTPGSVFIDIGAHIGTFSIPLSKVAKEVHAFEPTDHTRATLEENIKLNHCKNITVHPCAVGEHAGAVHGTSGGANRGMTYYTEVEGGNIPMRPLADEVAHADVIKIDAEGLELRILAGARAFIERERPIIYFELSRSQLARYGDSVFGLYRFFRELGYRTYFNPGHPHDTTDTPRLRTAFLPFFRFARKNVDILALPKELPDPR